MNRFLRFAIPLVAVAVTPALVSCGGDSSASPPPPAIMVSVAPPSSTVFAGATQALTATLQNDSSQRGVTWAISPASGAGTLSNAASTSVTYPAPASPSANDVIVTITATSVTDPARSAAATITVPAPFVTVDPSNGTVEAGATQTFTATVQYDPARKGVTWAISPTSGAGTLSNASSTSVTYTAPASPPASDVIVTITATSVTEPARSAAAIIDFPAPLVVLDPSSATLDAGGSQTFTAAVEHEPTQMGVTWAISPASGAGTLTDATTTSVTYHAPASPPPGDLAVTITATSVADSLSSTSAPITIKAVTVAVALTAASVTDPTKSATATITTSNGTVKLVPYALQFVSSKYVRKTQLDSTLTNVGSGALTIASIAIAGQNPDTFTQTNDCGASVGAGKSCAIQVTFTPKALGSFSALLVITDSAADSPQKVTLSGSACRYACPKTVALSSIASLPMSVSTPAPSGSQVIGTRVMQVTDAERVDPFVADGSKRQLMLRFWYPATPGSACPRAEYTTPAVWSYFAELTGVRLPRVMTHSCLDAPVAQAAFPIVIFSPGLTATFTDYTFLFEDLASRGYIVVSVDHTHEATAVAFADGRMAKSFYGSHLTRIEGLDERALAVTESARLGDVQLILDELQRLNVRRDSAFAAHLDTAAIAIAGHSLGGLTALQALESESTTRAPI